MGLLMSNTEHAGRKCVGIYACVHVGNILVEIFSSCDFCDYFEPMKGT